MGKRMLLQGNEAVVEGALAAGMRLFAGYPITPSTEIAEQAALKLPLYDGHFIQMEDEISSMAAVIGASAAGVKSMTATSGPGFSLKQENIGYACLAEIPCVIVDVQRSGPSTGLPTSPSQGDYMQARWGTHGDHPMIALSPSSVKECYELTVRAFNLSEKYRTPVILLMDEIIGHLREGIELPEQVEVIDRPVYEDEIWLPHQFQRDCRKAGSSAFRQSGEELKRHCHGGKLPHRRRRDPGGLLRRNRKSGEGCGRFCKKRRQKSGYVPSDHRLALPR